jgi:peptidyl-prolyl cis-trans isomerase SurA
VKKIKKIFFTVTKIVLGIIILLTLILFIYAGFFYHSDGLESDQFTNINQEEIIDEEQVEEERKIEELKLQEKISELDNQKPKIVNTIIKDGLYVTVGNKAITKSDIINEIKIILILNNKKYTEEIRDELRQVAIKTLIRRNIKKIEIDKSSFLQFNKNDLDSELKRIAGNINMDLKTLKYIFTVNKINFSILEDQIKTDLLWNSLVFAIYKNRISIDANEIEEKLKSIKNKKKINKYLISEIVISAVEKDKVNSTVKDLVDKILKEGFESVAKNFSLSDSSSRGGDVGWINENSISDKIRVAINATSVGDISNPVMLPNGIIIFKVRDKKTIEENLDMELVKEQLVNAEKTKILKMHSLSHYNNAKGSISMNFFQ